MHRQARKLCLIFGSSSYTLNVRVETKHSYGLEFLPYDKSHFCMIQKCFAEEPMFRAFNKITLPRWNVIHSYIS